MGAGYVFTRGGYVEFVKKLVLPPGYTLDRSVLESEFVLCRMLPRSPYQHRNACCGRYDGLVLSVCGDGKTYTLLLEAGAADGSSPSKSYFSRFSTRLGYSRV